MSGPTKQNSGIVYRVYKTHAVVIHHGRPLCATNVSHEWNGDEHFVLVRIPSHIVTFEDGDGQST